MTNIMRSSRLPEGWKKWVEPDGRSGESGTMTEPLIRPAVDADAAALGMLGRQTFLDTFVEGFGIP